VKWTLKGSKLKLILTSRTQETPLCNSNWFDQTPYTWVSPHFHWKPPFDNIYRWEPLVKKLNSENHHSKIVAKIPLCKNCHFKTSLFTHIPLWKQLMFMKTKVFSKTSILKYKVVFKNSLKLSKTLAHTSHMWNVWKQEPSHESFDSMQKQDMGLNWFCDQFWCKIQFGPLFHFFFGTHQPCYKFHPLICPPSHFGT
jgi:hypothetical protein